MKITGKKLVAMGYKPGRWFKDIIAQAEANNWNETEVRAYADRILPDLIEPRAKALPFYVNIEAENAEELLTIEQVTATMNELMKTPTLLKGAIMPDACPTGPIGQIPVGGVVVAENAIHPAMHSADVCCSVMMTNLGKIDPRSLMDKALRLTHFGGGGRKNPLPFPEELSNKMANNIFLNNEKSKMLARTHLGTQGDGNHFMYIGISEETGDTILVTHHGSRGLGAHLYRMGMETAERFRKERSPRTLAKNAWIPYDTEEGKSYWEAMQIVREWTKENHTVLHNNISQAVYASPSERFWNEHNFVFKRDNLFYHAKGATPLTDDFVPDSTNGLRLIPLNMAEPVLIVKGEATENNLGFAPHGAGRNISRTAHKRKNSHKTIEEIFAEETRGLDIRFYSNEIDISELPSAYKNAENVQTQMEKFNLGEVVDKILPYGSIMAGDWQVNAPWRKKRARKQSRKKRKGKR